MAARSGALSILSPASRVTKYIHVEVVRARRHHAADWSEQVLADISVGLYGDQARLVGVTTVTPAKWRAFCEMLDLLDGATTGGTALVSIAAAD